MANDTEEEAKRCSLCGGQHDVSKCPKADISGGSSVFVFKEQCQICGGYHERGKCPREDISGGTSVFVWKKCPRCGGQHDLDGPCPPQKRRRSADPVKQRPVQAEKPRAQPTSKLVTKKPATKKAAPVLAPPPTTGSKATEPPPAQPSTPKQAPRVGPTPSKADDCTLTLEGDARVTSIGADGKLVVKTSAGTVELPQPCRDTTIQSKPNTP